MKSSFMSMSLSNTSTCSSCPGSWVKMTWNKITHKCSLTNYFQHVIYEYMFLFLPIILKNTNSVILTSYISFQVGLRLVLQQRYCNWETDYIMLNKTLLLLSYWSWVNFISTLLQGEEEEGYNSEDEYSHVGQTLSEDEWREKDLRY